MKKGWEIKQLGDACDKASSNVSQNQLDNEVGEYPIFGASGLIKNVSFYHQDKPYLSIVKDGSGVGRVTKMDAFTSVIGTLQYILPNDGIDLDYLNYSLMSVDFKKYVAGAAIPHIYFKDYKNEPFLWMPLPEQQRLVAILNDVFADIEKAKANAEQNLKNAKELFESYLQGVFENKGEDWEEKTLGEVYDVRDGTHDSPKYQEEGFPLITSKNLKKDLLNYNNVNYISEQDYININKRSKVDKGDILFAMIGTIGNPVVIQDEPDFAIKNVALFKVPKGQNSNFLKYYLDAKSTIDKMMGDAKGTTQKFVGLGYLRSFEILLPPLKEQENIVQKLDALSTETKKLEAIYQQKINDLEELKKSVLQKAFSGELKTATALV
jgi:type I restriction enzyme S subunit